MPLMLSDLLYFAQECLDKNGDMPVYIDWDEDEEDLYDIEEIRQEQDHDKGKSHIVLAAYDTPAAVSLKVVR